MAAVQWVDPDPSAEIVNLEDKEKKKEAPISVLPLPLLHVHARRIATRSMRFVSPRPTTAGLLYTYNLLCRALNLP